jgi:DNA-directed RNA polymerase specialized sigma24 family protein
MSGIRPLGDAALLRRSPEQILCQVRRARRAGAHGDARHWLGLLAWRYRPMVRACVAQRVPAEHVDDVTASALTRALTARFDGVSVGEYVRFLRTIADRSACDFHRHRARQPAVTTLGDEHDGWQEPAAEDGEIEALGVHSAIRDVLSDVRPAHAEAVMLHVLGGWSAAEVAARVPRMTAANVHQVATRFRRSLRDALVRS